jgi:hypothetical protein
MLSNSTFIQQQHPPWRLGLWRLWDCFLLAGTQEVVEEGEVIAGHGGERNVGRDVPGSSLGLLWLHRSLVFLKRQLRKEEEVFFLP